MNQTYDNLFQTELSKTQEQVRLYAKVKTGANLSERDGFPLSKNEIYRFLDLYISNEDRYKTLHGTLGNISQSLAIENTVIDFDDQVETQIPLSASVYTLLLNEYLFNLIIYCYAASLEITDEEDIEDISNYYRKHVHNDNYYLFFRKMREQWLET